jgi:two-component sensor histidine kinase
MSVLDWLLGGAGALPSAQCMLWRPDLVILYAVADIVIALSAIAIPLGIAWYMRRRPGMPYQYRVLAWSFGAFVGACGLVHLLEAFALWHPIYGLEGLAKGITAAISGATVALVWPLLPGLVRLPSSRQLAEVNARLRQVAESHEATLRDLEDARRELETRVEERTGELTHVTARLETALAASQAAEANLRDLMRELTHRSKNLLAVIQAMARQTARHAATIESFLDRFGERLQALADSHDLLVLASWYGASLSELVRSQLGHYLDREEPQVTMEGPELLLKPEAAQNIGLALHELATNAAKYGALSVPDGHVTIMWRHVQPAAGPGVEIAWSESGGPTVAEPKWRGFGTHLIEQNLARSLEAEISLTFRPDGVRCRMAFPASNLAPGR